MPKRTHTSATSSEATKPLLPVGCHFNPWSMWRNNAPELRLKSPGPKTTVGLTTTRPPSSPSAAPRHASISARCLLRAYVVVPGCSSKSVSSVVGSPALRPKAATLLTCTRRGVLRWSMAFTKWAVPSALMRVMAAASAGWNDTRAAQWYTVSTPSKASSKLAWSVTSPSHHVNRSSPSGHAFCTASMTR